MIEIKKLLLSFFVFFSVLSSVVLATPGIPHQFYGTVTINGNPAPDDTVVTAKIDGVTVETGTVKDGKYGYGNDLFLVEDPNNNRVGKTIKFYVDDIYTGKSVSFCNGCVDELDLSVVKESSSSGSGGGGGSSGGSILVTTTTINEQNNNVTTENLTTTVKETCEEKWVCTDWSRCVDGIQTRKCIDQNSCGTDVKKPMESQPCNENESTMNSPVGRFLSSSTGIGTMIAGIAIVFAGFFLYHRKR